MVTANLTRLITDIQGNGAALEVTGDKLIIQGGKPAAALVRRLSAALDENRPAVLAEVNRILALPTARPFDLSPFAAESAPAVSNPAYDAPVTATMLSDADLDPKDPTLLAHYQHYVGKVVTDEVVTGLIHDANRHGFQITFEAQGDWRNDCDYLVTSARFVRGQR